MARVGIDLGGTKIEGVLLDEEVAVINRQRIATPRDDYPGTIAAVCGLVRLLQQAGAGEDSPPLTIGIGTPGVWVPSRRVMKNCNSVWLNGKPLWTDLEMALGQSIQLANDADCFALAEARAGAAVGSASVFGAILGTGVGGGFVFADRLLQGPSGLAGEWGHNPLPWLRCDRSMSPELQSLEARLCDRPCYCGRHNCIETFLSGPGLALTHNALHGQTMAPEDIGRGCDESARQTLRLYCVMLARSLAMIVNIVDPECIVLGGGVSNIPGIVERTAELIRRYVFSYECETRVCRARLGDSAGVIGAAWLKAGD